MNRWSMAAACFRAFAVFPARPIGQSNSPAGQSNSGVPAANAKKHPAEKKPAQKQATAKPLSPAEELQKAITDAGNDRTALVRNLQGYLEKYPDAPERP